MLERKMAKDGAKDQKERDASKKGAVYALSAS